MNQELAQFNFEVARPGNPPRAAANALHLRRGREGIGELRHDLQDRQDRRTHDQGLSAAGSAVAYRGHPAVLGVFQSDDSERDRRGLQSLRQVRAECKNGNRISYSRPGELVIPFRPDEPDENRPAWIVNGQQRMAAICSAKIKSFPICVVGFIASDDGEQREQFILVNSTKPLPKGLIYEDIEPLKEICRWTDGYWDFGPGAN